MKDDITAIIEKYAITKTEMIQIINNKPKWELDLHVLIKNIEERMNDETIAMLLNDIQQLFE